MRPDWTALFLIGALASILVDPSAAQDLEDPGSYLGYPLGEQFTPHHRVLDYVRQVADASDRVALEEYGQTYEGRPLMVAFVSSRENIARLESIRQGNLALAGLGSGDSPENPVAVVWLSYNVHGNESVSTEAALETLFRLASAEGELSDWLKRTVVVIDPCINPDGRDRYVNWYNQQVGRFPDANPLAVEHREPWPGGRGNHYLFDLNRDWAWQSQQESRQRMALMNRWMPHVHVDFHEQGVNSPYYFAPAAQPVHRLVSDWQEAFQDSVGTNNAKRFDAEGWLYFTGEVFDLFYPGYGDSYPTFNGAIGMTYEQGGSGRAGLGIETAEGDTLTLRDRIDHHVASGMSTVETTARIADRVTDEFAEFFASAARMPVSRWGGFVIKAETGRDRMAALASHLDRLGIQYGSVRASRRLEGDDYRTRATATMSAEPGDLVIPAVQPKGVLTSVLMEPEGELADSLTYDITAWALPYVYGLNGFASFDPVSVDAPFALPSGAESSDASRYGYLVRWESLESARFLADILAKGVSARVATLPFSIGGGDYDPGTLILTRTGNEALGDRFDEVIREAAARTGRSPIPVNSGRVDRGSDFGSGSVRYVAPPRVALASGSITSSGSSGAAWHYLDEILGYPATRIDAGRLGDLDLSEFDVLVLPAGSYRWSSEAQQHLLDWVQEGGRVVAMGSALGALSKMDTLKLKKKGAEDEADDEGPDPLRSYANRIREGLPDDAPGSIHMASVDATHPLGFGFPAGYFTLKRSSDSYAYLEGGGAWNVGTLRGASRLAGHIGHEAADLATDSFAFGVRDVGRGAVVMFADDPLFRGFWYEGQFLFANALLMPMR